MKDNAVSYHIRSLADIFLPRTCVVCGSRLGAREHMLCLRCLSDIPLTRFWDQEHNAMADKYNERIQRDLKPGQSEAYSRAAALFYYRSGSDYREMTRALKYKGNLAEGKFAATLLGEKLAGSELFADVDAVIPVPLHWSRRFSRGYNQADVVGRELAAALGARLYTDVLVRCRHTRSQTRLSGEAKSANVRGAFALRKEAEGLVARHMLLVDDVFTTGSTLAECRRALREAFGAEVRISVATLGFVGD